jgi:hypothetical protein
MLPRMLRSPHETACGAMSPGRRVSTLNHGLTSFVVAVPQHPALVMERQPMT